MLYHKGQRDLEAWISSFPIPCLTPRVTWPHELWTQLRVSIKHLDLKKKILLSSIIILNRKILGFFYTQICRILACRFTVQQVGLQGTWPTLIFEPNRTVTLWVYIADKQNALCSLVFVCFFFFFSGSSGTANNLVTQQLNTNIVWFSLSNKRPSIILIPKRIRIVKLSENVLVQHTCLLWLLIAIFIITVLLMLWN